MQKGLEGCGCRKQPSQILNDIKSSEEGKKTFLKYLKNIEFVFLEQTLSKRIMREKIREPAC